MASSQNSPVLVQHASPPHTLSPDVVVSIAAFSPEPESEPQPPSPPPGPIRETELVPDPSLPETEPSTPTVEAPDAEMADAPPTNPESSSESNLEAALQQDQSNADEQPVAESEDVPTDSNLAEEWAAIPEPDVNTIDTAGQGTQTPPSAPVIQDPQAEIPEWVTWDDDLSTPTEEEMTEIRLRESRGTELSALDVPSVEKRIYQDVDDPDQRPVKKLRLSWVIKGVRGTKDKPNHARVMVSPAALVDGNYWQIKFYPRGNKCVSLSAYIKCSRHPPKTDGEVPDSMFSFFEGPPDANLGTGAVPIQTLKTDPRAREKTPDTAPPSTVPDSEKQENHGVSEETSQDPHETSDNEQQDTNNAGKSVEEEWRVSAQLGMVMYNPEEPRTCTYMSSEHQFAKSNDDWGWTNFVGPWRDIHLRQHCQRTPLLQNDTIAIDAYIRIFDDPSQSLWWHSSDVETQWDSKSLAGYYPMGTPPLYHSPAVAGLTSWLLLAPFRKVLQDLDAGEWRRNSQVRPRPVICQLQMNLFLMRHLKKERETYVDVYPAIQLIRDLGEVYNDVKTFWEVLRRTIELELAGDEVSLKRLSDIFDSPDGPVSLPPLPVEGILDIQQSLSQVLREQNFKGRLPNLLSLPLARQRFDKKAREWKLLHDRVILNEELDISEFCADIDQAKYTLYGFIVHVGERSSGKFYSVLRPSGPNTKWLAFEDGDGNKVFSYTRKRIQDFEGLEGQALKDFTSTRQTAYLAMYVKTSCLSEYLPGKLEPYSLPHWLGPFLGSQYHETEATFTAEASSNDSEEIAVEIYSDKGIIGTEGLLDMSTVKEEARRQGLFYLVSMPKTSTFQDLRRRMAQMLQLDDPQMIRLFRMRYSGMGHNTSAQMRSINLEESLGDGQSLNQPTCLWLSILKTKGEIELFAEPDRPPSIDAVPDPSQSASENSPDEEADGSAEDMVAAADAEQASVQAAVLTDIQRTSDETEQASAAVVEIVEPDTPMQLEIPPPTAEESLTADVPHGHLIDAAAHEESATTSGNAASQELADPGVEESLIAAVIREIPETMDFVMNTGTESTDQSNSQSAESSQPTSPPPEKLRGPVDNVYCIIQVFDIGKQVFRVLDTFFAKLDGNVRESLRERLGYGVDKEFVVWRRESVVEGSNLGPEDTFNDHKFVNGVELVIMEPLSDDQTKELDRDGKITNPNALSQYLRMMDRKHPVHSKTTTEPIELMEFGTQYYKGQLVNGRAHGPDAVFISANGNIYEGPLVCNRKSGKGGKMIYQNGDTYEGDWDQDERHGQGTFVEARTGNKYVGGFEYGKRWGMGTTYWQVADEQADLCQICYGQEIDALFFDCGHVCSCVECARQCEICPICRRSVKQVVKMFRA